MRTVYLAGAISPVPRTFEWRAEAHDLLHEEFLVLDPTADIDRYDPIFIYTKGRGHTGKRSSGIFRKDYSAVYRADIVLVNLTAYEGRPLCGTYFELAWAFDWKTPIIAFFEGEGLLDHPFVHTVITERAADLPEACEKILWEYM